jgi:hypothetical protein
MILRIVNIPIVPKTTQGKVFPRMNSRILVMSRRRPPRKTMGPLLSFNKLGSNRQCVFVYLGLT